MLDWGGLYKVSSGASKHQWINTSITEWKVQGEQKPAQLFTNLSKVMKGKKEQLMHSFNLGSNFYQNTVNSSNHSYVFLQNH